MAGIVNARPAEIQKIKSKGEYNGNMSMSKVRQDNGLGSVLYLQRWKKN
jgi:hypothetical protein